MNTSDLTMPAMTRPLGPSDIEISAMGFGCWAIGGPMKLDNGSEDGWGEVNDNETQRAIHCALDLGVNFFDTSDVYGTGHSESVLGQALQGRRKDVVIATKFGYTYNAAARQITGVDVSPNYIREACQESLNRLNTDYIDLYQLHVDQDFPPDVMAGIIETLKELQAEGLIRTYGWSTDNVTFGQRFLGNPHFVSIQSETNVLHDATSMLDFCNEHNLAAICRGPLAMGLLSGKFNADSLLSKDDVRGAGYDWVRYFQDGRPKAEFLQKLDAIREILTSEGRTLVQGALAWHWGRSAHSIPIPGFKTVRQAEENAGAMRFGPLAIAQVEEIDRILER